MLAVAPIGVRRQAALRFGYLAPQIGDIVGIGRLDPCDLPNGLVDAIPVGVAFDGLFGSLLVIIPIPHPKQSTAISDFLQQCAKRFTKSKRYPNDVTVAEIELGGEYAVAWRPPGGFFFNETGSGISRYNWLDRNCSDLASLNPPSPGGFFYAADGYFLGWTIDRQRLSFHRHLRVTCE